MVKLSGIIIGGVFSILIFMSFIFLYVDGATKYTITDYNESTLSVFNDSLSSFESNSIRAKQSLSQLQGNPNIQDILGSIFGGAYSSLALLGDSLDIFSKMTTVGVGNLRIGGIAVVLISVLTLGALIVFFIGILADYIRPGGKM
jgi:hypothetical protein